ncbi:TAXI family TRAP transporter solute-binding subunit [Leucobacter chromiireducens]|uniref:TAXI family TRAP transporter solute-binding subunit n=1 Tax=Leucobacter chromiireducens TaxID=283877 RepID=UPI001F15007F|nr:TAXI family TRAP transporter solute-binding subunit [Leucobacter chromiireducens]
MSGGRRRVARVRRAVQAIALLTGALLALAGCAGLAVGDGEKLQIAGGGAAGVYYAYGDRLAAELRDELGIDISVVETHGSVDNLTRVADGSAIVGFAQGDTAADAIAGTGDFSEPLAVQAIARVYDEFVHVVVPADSDIDELAELAGRRVSLGAPNSGVQVIATRVLAAAGVEREQLRVSELGVNASIEAMRTGRIDAFFWVGGVPTPGIAQFAEATPVRLLSIDPSTVERVNAGHAGVYRTADFPVAAYETDAPTATMTVPNYLVTASSADPDLVRELTRVLFARAPEIARTVPAAHLLDRRQAIFTEPIELHSGAVTYYRDARN